MEKFRSRILEGGPGLVDRNFLLMVGGWWCLDGDFLNDNNELGGKIGVDRNLDRDPFFELVHPGWFGL